MRRALGGVGIAVLAIVMGAAFSSPEHTASASVLRRAKTTTTTRPVITATRRITTTTTQPVTSPPSTTTTVKAPVTVSHFSTLPVGSGLPSDATCAAQVRVAAEQRPDNTTANHTVPPSGGFSLAPLGVQNGYDSRSPTLEARVTGNFTGTTDEIIQWASCKWGFDEDVVRAIAVAESNWHQSQLGDYQSTNCPPGYAAPCPMSFGIHQIKWSDDPNGTYPWSQQSTAFNLDESLMVHRLCYEGYISWLHQYPGSTTPYSTGDLWGCVGQWYSGSWWDSGARSYIASVQSYVTSKPWTQAGF